MTNATPPLGHKVKLQAITCELPRHQYRNDAPVFDNLPEVSDRWWRFWGIQQRGFLDPLSGDTELAAAERAVTRLLQRSGTDANEIDLLLCSAPSPILTDGGGVAGNIARRMNPRLGRILAQRLALTRALPLDIQVECAGFLLGLAMAASYIRIGLARNVLVVSSECVSQMLDFTSRSSTIFADGCGAALLARGDPQDPADMLASAHYSNAEHYEIATARWRRPEGAADTAAAHDLYFTLEEESQAQMQEFVPTHLPAVVERALTLAGLTADDIAYYVFHQPSPLLVEAWASRLRCPEGRYGFVAGQTGVMISTAVAHALCTALRENRLRPGDNAVMAGVGTGWGFVGQVWRLGDVQVC
ncbi:MAG: 3-oxoacyl-ACP synthase III family protein [Cupriavidus sp.]|nr:3-oxoacyl-ACP synthase III family protein [Cupriavidus sp.]